MNGFKPLTLMAEESYLVFRNTAVHTGVAAVVYCIYVLIVCALPSFIF